MSSLEDIALTVIVALSLAILQRILAGIQSFIRCYGAKNSILTKSARLSRGSIIVFIPSTSEVKKLCNNSGY